MINFTSRWCSKIANFTSRLCGKIVNFTRRWCKVKVRLTIWHGLLKGGPDGGCEATEGNFVGDGSADRGTSPIRKHLSP